MTDRSVPMLECHDITVRYGAVTALSAVNASFARGLIHAVVGQNGAGKTTFARVLAGLVRPDHGLLNIGGHALRGGNVKDARKAGVELVHQSFALPPSFTVAEAMQFGVQGVAVFTRRRLEQRWQQYLQDLDINVPVRTRIRDLPVELQQGVEIARALVADAKLLILDEPTAVLSPEGAEKLFARIRRLKARGVTVILILHKIREVLAVADTVTVLRGGRLVEAGISCDGVDADRLSEWIIGASAGQELRDEFALPDTASISPETPAASRVEVNAISVLRMTGVSTRADSEGPALKEVNLNIQPGEIVGVAGVEGNGQRTLVRAVTGLADVTAGDIAIHGNTLTQAPLAVRRAAGLRVIPFERNTEGLSLSSPLWENWSVRGLLQKSLLSVMQPGDLRNRCDAILKQWDVRYDHVDQAAGALSGGNAQKVILAREMDADAHLILAAQPTRGLDIGATAFVWRAMRHARTRGCGLLFISSDLDELFDISDRVLVMLSGRIVAEFFPPYDIATVGAAMTGVRQ